MYKFDLIYIFSCLNAVLMQFSNFLLTVTSTLYQLEHHIKTMGLVVLTATQKTTELHPVAPNF